MHAHRCETLVERWQAFTQQLMTIVSSRLVFWVSNASSASIQQMVATHGHGKRRARPFSSALLFALNKKRRPGLATDEQETGRVMNVNSDNNVRKGNDAHFISSAHFFAPPT
jgi:hypothetical protein